MGSNAAMERLKGELHRLVDRMHADLDRVEILVAALGGFSRPVPDYKPRFQHLGRAIERARTRPRALASELTARRRRKMRLRRVLFRALESAPKTGSKNALIFILLDLFKKRLRINILSSVTLLCTTPKFRVTQTPISDSFSGPF